MEKRRATTVLVDTTLKRKEKRENGKGELSARVVNKRESKAQRKETEKAPQCRTKGKIAGWFIGSC